ncbi:MAG: vanadium-dependent haloperoxidase [Acidimicrobiia bacterium]|nr:vanadium-dependent haloperoxidase [Acidimicrobiia bacterium]MDX2466379.1 vanadium-dependent haloperoxidase [Acidimicrobiia bacterium]
MPTGRSKTSLVVVVGLAMLLGAVVFLGTRSDSTQDACPAPEGVISGLSVARRWDEAVLNAVRRDLPAPTVHARNLFHVAAAMWDAWAVYDPVASGYFFSEKHDAGDVAVARNETISYAAYRVAEHRYIDAAGGSDSIPEFNDLMESLCYPINITTVEGDSPAAVGNRIAATIIEYGLSDGAREEDGYVDPSYAPINEALVVSESGTTMSDPNRWQPLQIENMISQNGIPVVDGTQEFIGPHWGYVTGFAIPGSSPDGVPVDPGPPPYLGDPKTDAEFKESVIEVIRISSLLDPRTEVTVDISPATLGGNSLGANDGRGHDINPVTGQPYAENLVNEAEFARAVAEFWADGPHSETPPGHWNTLANEVSDLLAADLRIGGSGDPVDRLEWDVKLYFALNGATHDGAIVAWGAKGFYDYVRPISMIRYMGGLGQSTDPAIPSYHPDGLPLVDGLIEVIPQSGGPPSLQGHEGEIAVQAWAGNPADPEVEIGGVEWILAVDWVPYQLPTFVTPSCAAYVAGHSSFSRAAAEVLAEFTGDVFFPGGLGEWTIPAGSFEFESGPDNDIVLQWGTYFDAADQAGRSRLYGGIHVAADDLQGRIIGAEVGQAAWELAAMYFAGGASG